MASQGPNSPTAAINNPDTGVDPWANPTNVFASDDSRATAGSSFADVTNLLEASGFGFAVPAGSSIAGVLVEVERSKTGLSTVKDLKIQLIQSGAQLGNDKADIVTGWPSADAYASYGSS